ncbi:hypothetical protein F5883DRAFT_22806 [Diaporthe sp. PMI_573]|nr:hypothetical protein F5883DRAFT_22806 [Diaporthaceae sp. PMI_573]
MASEKSAHIPSMDNHMEQDSPSENTPSFDLHYSGATPVSIKQTTGVSTASALNPSAGTSATANTTQTADTSSSTGTPNAPPATSLSSTAVSRRRRGLGMVTRNACTECRKKRAKVLLHCSHSHPNRNVIRPRKPRKPPKLMFTILRYSAMASSHVADAAPMRTSNAIMRSLCDRLRRASAARSSIYATNKSRASRSSAPSRTTHNRVQIHTTKSTYGSIMWIHIHSIPFHAGFCISISTPRSPFHMFHMWKLWKGMDIFGGVGKYLDFLVK